MTVLVVAGRVEGQGLPVRTAIAARATVLPVPAAPVVRVDSALTLTQAMPAQLPADTTSAQRARQRRVVVSYPGT